MPTLAALQQERAELNDRFLAAMTGGEEIREKYAGKRTEKSDEYKMTADEEQRYDKFLDEADGLKSQIERLDKEIKLKAWSEKPIEETRPGYGGIALGENKSIAVQQYQQAHLKAYKKYLKAEGNRIELQHSDEYQAYTKSLQSPEVKAYQADNPAGGGFAVVPEVLLDRFLTLMKDLVFMRQMSTVIPVTDADTLGIVALDTDPSDADWTSELAVGNEETTAAVGKREMRPSPVAKYLKLSKTLVRKVPAFENLMLDRLGYKMAVTEEKAFMTGSGANRPLGIFTASAQGISTSRDVTAGASTVVAGDDFINVKYSLKPQYQNRAVWWMHRDTVKAVRKLKDSNGDYLWTAGMANANPGNITGPGGGLQGTPDMLLNRPIVQSEYAPNTFTTGLYLAVFGDPMYYYIADALGVTIEVLYELFALTNQMGYVLRKETDGMPVLEEAFGRLKLA